MSIKPVLAVDNLSIMTMSTTPVNFGTIPVNIMVILIKIVFMLIVSVSALAYSKSYAKVFP